jgi:hypothetical protein
VLHQVGQTIGHGVELALEGLLVALLSILQERYQQKGDDSGRSVDDELVGVEVANQEVSGCPEYYQQHAKGEERGPADEVGASTGEPIEERLSALLSGLRYAATFAHDQPLLYRWGLSGKVYALVVYLTNGAACEPRNTIVPTMPRRSAILWCSRTLTVVPIEILSGFMRRLLRLGDFTEDQ